MLTTRNPAQAVDGPALLEALDAGFALPSSWYTDRGIFDLEREKIFRRSWLFGTHTGELAKVGDVALCTVAGVPIVLVHDANGAIQGFVNICRHRAHQVALEAGNHPRNTLQCLYHGWTYRLDGSLLRAPRAEAEELAFDPSDYGLVPVQTHVWGPTVWVNLDPDAPPFLEWTTGLDAVVESHGVDISNQEFAFAREYEVKANWKVFLDNAVECYHCPSCHSQLSEVLVMNPNRQKTAFGGRYWSTSEIPFRNEDLNYFHHWIFPSSYFQYARAGFDVGVIDVVDIDRIVFRSLTFVPTDMSVDERNEREQRLDASPTIGEDVAICERVQAAHASGMAQPGRLLPRTEARVLYHQRVLIEMMSD